MLFYRGPKEDEWLHAAGSEQTDIHADEIDSGASSLFKEFSFFSSLFFIGIFHLFIFYESPTFWLWTRNGTLPRNQTNIKLFLCKNFFFKYLSICFSFCVISQVWFSKWPAILVFFVSSLFSLNSISKKIKHSHLLLGLLKEILIGKTENFPAILETYFALTHSLHHLLHSQYGVQLLINERIIFIECTEPNSFSEFKSAKSHLFIELLHRTASSATSIFINQN